MKKKIGVAICICLVLLVLGILWYKMPVKLTSLDPDDVSEIYVFSGMTGKELHITKPDEIEHIISNFNSVKLQRDGISMFRMGYRLNLAIYLKDGTEAPGMNDFIMNGPTIRKDPFFYKVAEGSLDYAYIENLENLTGRAPENEAPQAVAETLSDDEKLYQEYMQSAGVTDCAYRDLDGDGLNELLVYSGGELDIVTIRDEKAESVLSDALYSSGFFLCEDNVIGQYSEGGGGSAYWFYRIENQQLQKIDCLVYLFQEDAWYRSMDYTGGADTLVPIEKEDWKTVAEQYAPLDGKAEEYMKPLQAGLEDSR